MPFKFSIKFSSLFSIAIIIFLATTSFAQTSAFTYQGKLNDGGLPANGAYQFEFKLFDPNGNQIGQTISNLSATATNGIFAVNLDFGAAAFNGAPRSLEIGVRQNGSQSPYTVLSPRQTVTSAPYALKSLNAAQADTAQDAAKLGNIPAAQYVQTSDSRMSDSRDPLPGSGNYIQNSANQQSGAANFNISGEGKADAFDAAANYKIAGSRVFHLTGAYNTLVGFESGNSISGGNFNAFFGTFAGKNNTTGANNSFFGSYAGRENISGAENSFFGQGAGLYNATGGGNSFFGYGAGLNNTSGASNTFVGFLAGQSNTGENNNTFLGYKANSAPGITNATAIGANSIVTESNTMVLGTNAVTVKVPGNFNVAGTFSANALNSATVYKINNNRVFHLTGNDNTAVGFESGNSITTGGFNAFFGSYAGKGTTTGLNNAFFGSYAGRDNSTGGNNAFFGTNAGLSNNGSFNAFFGSGAGLSNTNGSNNSYFGSASGTSNSTGDNNSFFGSSAGKAVSNSSANSFFGSFAGEKTSTGAGNSFFGTFAGRENQIGFNNTFIGYQAGGSNFTTGNGNVAIGYKATFGNGVSNSIAIGENVNVTTSGTVKIGNNNTTDIYLTGHLHTGDISGNSITAGDGDFESISTSGIMVGSELRVLDDALVIKYNSGYKEAKMSTPLELAQLDVTQQLTAQKIRFKQFDILGSSHPLCYTSAANGFALVQCLDNLAPKENVRDFKNGLEIISRLRPVAFTWKADKTPGIGFVAEEVNAVEPLLTTANERGEIESIKYPQITTALVTAVKEQQTQIEKQNEQIKQQQTQIDQLKALVCQINPSAAPCAAQEKK